MTRRTLPRPLVVLIAALVVVAVSTVVALAAAWPIREGPAGTTCLVALLAFGISLMSGVSASEPVMRRAAECRDRSAPDPAPPRVPDQRPVPAAAPTDPAPAPAPSPAPDPAADWGSGRCFGCLRLEEVAGAGLLTLAESSVPLLLCPWRLEHLETWHAREAARLRTEREPSPRP